ncbi:MAG: 3'-5' exonuclease [Motiliproteus sp.]
MNTALFFDTETTGLPNWKLPSGDISQPHLVQLAAILADLDTGKVISSMDVIIKPDGWEIPQETIEIHGITNELAHAIGIDEEQVLGMLLSLCGDHRRVAHNRAFDQRIIRIACKRYATDQVTDKWANKDTFDCSMLQARSLMKHLPDPGKGSLASAYQHFCGKAIEGAHNAMVDARACLDLYLAMQKVA